ncbi:PadR family transcriptional regulator [Oenococcus sp. UCMA 17063]|nr:PadR family transcriptional regulator [Oenococcus sp. UCMA 17063]
MKSHQIILGILKNGPQTGYDLTRMFEVGLIFFNSSSGMVYPALRKLEKEGKVSKKVVTQQGKPNKNVFSITSLGEQEFENYLNSSVEPDYSKSDFLARLIFGQYVSSKSVIKLVKDEIDHETKELALLKRPDVIQPNHKSLTPTQKLAYDYGIFANKNKIEFFKQWLKDHPNGD